MNFLGEKLNFKIFLDFLTFFLDHQIKGIDFTLGDGNTEVYFACSLVFKGETLILGGKRNYNQVSFRWQWCWWLNDGETLRCWWQYHYVDDIFRCINDFFNIWNGHQHYNSVTKMHKLSPTQIGLQRLSVTIDVTEPSVFCDHFIFFFDRLAKWNLVDWNEMKKICHSTRIYMHKFIVAFIISNVASIKNPPKLHSFVVINNVSRECLFVTDSYICHQHQ